MDGIETANGLLDELGELTDEQGHVSLDDLVRRIGPRGFGPLLFVPALIGMSPLGGIPGVPTLIALALALIAGQVLIGRRHIWLPGVLRRRNVTADALGHAIDVARPAANRMDRWFGRRLAGLVSRPAKIAAAAIVLGLCATVPPLELVPFAAVAPMGAIALIGLGFTARDGMLMLAGLCVAGGALIMAAEMLLSG